MVPLIAAGHARQSALARAIISQLNVQKERY
jgi:hypothetical protein